VELKQNKAICEPVPVLRWRKYRIKNRRYRGSIYTSAIFNDFSF